MGAEYNNWRREKKKQQCKVKQEEGFTSNQPELAALLLALRDALIEEPLLYLCDNQSLLKAVSRGISEVRNLRATLVGAPDMDILAAAIEIGCAKQTLPTLFQLCGILDRQEISAWRIPSSV